MGESEYREIEFIEHRKQRGNKKTKNTKDKGVTRVQEVERTR